MKTLSNRKKELLKDFVNYTCEECGLKSEKLHIHRINRGYLGGEYVLRNIKVICEDCHRRFHYHEF